jgi:hypothetical protein
VAPSPLNAAVSHCGVTPPMLDGISTMAEATSTSLTN